MDKTMKEKTPLDEYLSLPEGYPAELIGGEIRMVPSPGRKHQELAARMFVKLRSITDKYNLGESLYEFDLHVDEETVVKPDIVFVSKERIEIIKDEWIDGAPDIVVEILSPSTAVRDTIIKKELYEKLGVKEYWIVDPEGEEVFVFENEGNKFSLICSGRKCRSKVIEKFEWEFEAKKD